MARMPRLLARRAKLMASMERGVPSGSVWACMSMAPVRVWALAVAASRKPAKSQAGRMAAQSIRTGHLGCRYGKLRRGAVVPSLPGLAAVRFGMGGQALEQRALELHRLLQFAIEAVQLFDIALADSFDLELMEMEDLLHHGPDRLENLAPLSTGLQRFLGFRHVDIPEPESPRHGEKSYLVCSRP